MIVWGGRNGSLVLNNGARYNPKTNTWRTIEVAGAPNARERHTAFWTGDVMIIWGGNAGGYPYAGGLYNPSSNTWAIINTVGEPSERTEHTAVWTGTEMIVWGGLIRAPQGGNEYVNDGGRYNPNNNQWIQLTTTDAPAPRANHTALWAGNKMIVWGGSGSFGAFNNTFIYTPSQNFYIYQRP
jgi:N-acetylneuraminic acid mutarotase